MAQKNSKCDRKAISLIPVVLAVALAGCSGLDGYSSESIYPADISTVYVKMFDNASFRRGVEYELTDALAKRIETDTPYKVVSDMSRADTVLSGRLVVVDEGMLTVERQTGRSLEKQVYLNARVTWKNLKTGELLLDNQTVTAAAPYSQWQSQSFRYASALAANNLAEHIVESMSLEW